MAKDNVDDDFDIDDADAERLLNDIVENDDDSDSGEPEPKARTKDRDTGDGDDEGDPAALREPGKRALDAMKRERNAARKELAAARARLKEIDDKGKTDTERLTEAHKEAASRAEKAEQGFLALQVAMERAPAHATLTQVRAVAKRIRGESEEDLEADADELFEMVAPAPKQDDTPKKRVPTNPRQRLRGGADPDEEPEESNPRKLADAIRQKH